MVVIMDTGSSSFGVSARAGTLRGSGGMVLSHQWTEEGVLATPAMNGAQVLHLGGGALRPE